MSLSRSVRGYIWSVFNIVLKGLDYLFTLRPTMNDDESECPIFIVGSPRCGSTLVMQVICDAYDIGYISNVHCRWFGSPAMCEAMFHPLDKKNPSDYRSDYGGTRQETDPSECGAWWYRYFPRVPPYVTGKDVSARKMYFFRRSLASMAKAFGKPVIFKNLYAGLRINPIADTIPSALFVVVERDLANNAESILKGRFDAHSSYDKWWSVPPPDRDEIAKLPPVPQVVEQSRSIYKLIDEDLQQLGVEDRTFRVQYEEFCADVHKTLYEFERFMRGHGIMLNKRFDVPKYFEINHERKIPQEMYDELLEYVRREKVPAELANRRGQTDQGTTS